MIAKYQKLLCPSYRLGSHLSHVDIDDRFCDGMRFLIFERMSAHRVSKLDTNATPSHDPISKKLHQGGESGQSPICSTQSLLFGAIVAVEEVEVVRCQVLIIRFLPVLGMGGSE